MTLPPSPDATAPTPDQDARNAPPSWDDAPPGWDWLAQDEDGRWFWYRTCPVPGIGGGVWRANSRAQQLAAQGRPNPDWHDSLRQRPGHASAPTQPDT